MPKKLDLTPRKPEDPPHYWDVNLKLANVNLPQFVESLGVKLSFPVDGKLSFQVKVSVPIDRPGDLEAYKVEGTAQAPSWCWPACRSRRRLRKSNTVREHSS